MKPLRSRETLHRCSAINLRGDPAEDPHSRSSRASHFRRFVIATADSSLAPGRISVKGRSKRGFDARSVLPAEKTYKRAIGGPLTGILIRHWEKHLWAERFDIRYMAPAIREPHLPILQEPFFVRAAMRSTIPISTSCAFSVDRVLHRPSKCHGPAPSTLLPKTWM
jgi:hypothetical protein